VRRWIPLLMILAGLAALGTYFGPDLYRGLLFRRDCAALLEATAAGDLSQVAAQLTPTQQSGIGALITDTVPAGYEEYIESLRMTRWWRVDKTTIWAIVTVRLGNGDGLSIYQGKLRWIYDPAARRWWWDFNGSYGAPLASSGEPVWQRLGDLIQLTEQL